MVIPIHSSRGMTTKAILGNNFLRDQESNTAMKLGVLTIDDETHLLQIERTFTCCCVRLTNSVEILPQRYSTGETRANTAHTQSGMGNWAIHGNSPGRFFKTTGTNLFT